MVALISRLLGGHLKPSRIAFLASGIGIIIIIVLNGAMSYLLLPICPQVQHEGFFCRLQKCRHVEYPNLGAMIALTQCLPEDLLLLYIGMASYGIAEYHDMQMGTFSSMGVTVQSLNMANKSWGALCCHCCLSDSPVDHHLLDWV
jgi:hypothetical protein